MRQSLAKLAMLVSSGGCSIIYNANNIHPSVQDAPIDVVADADPTMLELLSVAPSTIYEGQGVAGDLTTPSRAAVIVISGHQMVKDQTTVAVTVHPGEMKNPTVTVDNTQLDVSADGDMIAVPISVAQVDNTAFSSADSIRFDVSVTQNTINGSVTKMLSAVDGDKPVLLVNGLDELTGTNVVGTPTEPPKVYSRVNVTGALSGPMGGSLPLVIRATSSIKIGAKSTFNAAGLSPGVYGGAGGPGGPGGLLNGSTGTPGGGMGGGQPSGGRGTYVGTEQLTSMLDPNRGGGGAGGDGVALAAKGGDGGGAGGSIELTAGGDLSVVGGIEAKGASGTTSTNNGGAGGGGVVLLRAGGSVTVSGTVDVSGGAGPGLAGDPGRVRIDAPNTINPGATPMFYRGPTFATTTPLIVRSKTASVTVLNQPQRNIQYYINDANGAHSHGPVTVLTPQNGMATFTLDAELFKGLNQLCAIVDGANAGVPAAGECIDIAWLP